METKTNKIKLIKNPLGFNLALGSIILLRADASVLQQVVRNLQVQTHTWRYPFIFVFELLAKLFQHKNFNVAIRKHSFEAEVKAVLFDTFKYGNRYAHYVSENCSIIYKGGVLSEFNEFVSLNHLDNDLEPIVEDDLDKAVAAADAERESN